MIEACFCVGVGRVPQNESFYFVRKLRRIHVKKKTFIFYLSQFSDRSHPLCFHVAPRFPSLFRRRLPVSLFILQPFRVSLVRSASSLLFSYSPISSNYIIFSTIFSPSVLGKVTEEVYIITFFFFFFFCGFSLKIVF